MAYYYNLFWTTIDCLGLAVFLKLNIINANMTDNPTVVTLNILLTLSLEDAELKKWISTLRVITKPVKSPDICPIFITLYAKFNLCFNQLWLLKLL